MKRLLSVILVLVCLCAAAAAESPSIEELQAQAAEIQMEILRLRPSFDVYQGVYIIGQDIPAGIYRVELKRGSIIAFELYREDGLYAFSGLLCNDPDLGDSVIGRVELEDGQRLVLDGSVTFIPYTGIMP